jgi:hypothetical protein
MGIELILAALGAGAAAASKDVASQAVKDAYTAFKGLLQRHFAESPQSQAAQTALDQYAAKPDIWKAPLEDALTTTGAASDPAILGAARDLQELSERELAGASATGDNARAVNTQSGSVAMDNATLVEPTFGGNISGSTITIAGRDATGGNPPASSERP